jgi:DNA polymerase I
MISKINPHSLKIIHSLPPVAQKGDKVAIDSEFFGQTKGRLHRPHGTFAWLGCSFDGETVYWIDDESQIQEFFTRLNLGVFIFHHAKYDITQLRQYAHLPPRKLLWDTMLIEQIMYSGFHSEFSLADLARRYLDVYMSKEIRKEFSDDTVLSQEQIEYASVDVVATWRVYKAQRAIIDENDLEIWKSIELPFLWTLLSMGGVKLDTQKWIALAEKNGNKAKEIQDKYGCWKEVQGKRSVKNVFEGVNLNSPAQVKKHLSKLGYNLKSSDVEALESIAGECDFAREMLEYRTCAKRASTYGKKFVEDYVEEDGKIYADIYQNGAETGRTSCRAPNLQNQPHEFEYRDCFMADDGNLLVVADWGSQEPRIAAYLSQDEKLIAALNGKEKLYIAVARDVLGKTITKDSPEYTHIKSTVLGIFYGMSAKGLAARIGVSVEAAQDMIDAFLETYPGVKEYMDRQHQAKDYVKSIYGRRIWLNKYSYQWERNALNAPIQASAADAMKIAAARFVDTYGEGEPLYDTSPLRLLVHDEIVLEVYEGFVEMAKEYLEECMIIVAEEMHEGIKGVAEIHVGKTWACKS